ncbi:MAG: glutathione S-transferase [Pseudomonadota bacterium]
MTYRLAIAERVFSSWSLRGWLLFEKFGLQVEVTHAPMRTPAFDTMLAAFGPARTVPAMGFDDVVLWDSQAMVETLAERHPDAGFWPEAPAARACARVLVAQMHAGFSALRQDCPMNLAHTYSDFAPSDALRAELARLAELWDWARSFGGEGPWLFGAYSAADAFYAPVATRIATYGLPMPARAMGYVADHLADPAFRQWRARGLAEPERPTRYDLNLPRGPWPGPDPLPARPLPPEALAQAINSTCPFSGAPIVAQALAEVEGKTLGFCNRFCRDKTVADAAAWPQVMALL